MKGGIEGCDLRDVGQQFPCGMHRQQGDAVVEGCELGQRLDSLEHPVVDARGGAIPGPAVHHPMPDRIDLLAATNLELSKQASHRSLETMASGGVGA